MQGQPNLTGADSAILSGFTNADVFMNMNISKGPGHPKEFSIQNEQEFPALPTSTQPREEQLSSVSDIQSSLQVILCSLYNTNGNVLRIQLLSGHIQLLSGKLNVKWCRHGKGSTWRT